MNKYMIRMTYSPSGKFLVSYTPGDEAPRQRFFGAWVELANAEEVAYLWRVRVGNRFPGLVRFDVVRIEPRITMNQLDEYLRLAGDVLMAGMLFKYKIDERVVFIPEGAIVKIRARTIDSVGKAYLIKYKSGRLGGYVPERALRKLTEGDE